MEAVEYAEEKEDYFEVEEVKESQQPDVFSRIDEAMSPEKVQQELKEQLQPNDPTPDSDEDDYDKYLDQIEQKAAADP